MSGQPNIKQELQNRKILEELQLQKKQLLSKSGSVSSVKLTPSLPANVPFNPISMPYDGQHMLISSQQRSALQHAQMTSPGYFIPQDSAFGNLILPAMKRKQLESKLEPLQSFTHPKVHLEQYATSPHIASCMLFSIEYSFGEVKNQLVADLGCGCGVLTAGCSLLEVGHCVGIDIDCSALQVAAANMAMLDVTCVDFLTADVIEENIGLSLKQQFDCVIMNPPFGTKHFPGADLAFLRQAFLLSTGSVYSLHKTSTRSHVIRKAEQWGAEVEVLAELRYDLPRSYKFHQKSSVDIEVDFYRFDVQNKLKKLQ